MSRAVSHALGNGPALFTATAVVLGLVTCIRLVRRLSSCHLPTCYFSNRCVSSDIQAAVSCARPRVTYGTLGHPGIVCAAWIPAVFCCCLFGWMHSCVHRYLLRIKYEYWRLVSSLIYGCMSVSTGLELFFPRHTPYKACLRSLSQWQVKNY